MYHKLKKQKY